MKKRIFVLSFAILSCIGFGFSQKNFDTGRIESIRIAYITEKLELSPDQAKAFWPVFDKYHNQIKELKSAGKPEASLDDMTDDQIEALIQKRMDARFKEVQLERQMVEELKPILPMKKIAKMSQIDREFKQELLKRVQEQKQHNRDGGLGPRKGNRG